MATRGARRTWLLAVGLVLCAGASGAVLAMPTILEEPAKREADGTTTPLSTDPGSPTVFLWGDGETIVWWAMSDSAPSGIPTSDWHVRDEGGDTTGRPSQWCNTPATRFCARPEEHLSKQDYEFWITATDDEGTVSSETYFIRMNFPPLVPTDYHPVANEFLGKLARKERTAFNHGEIPSGILDAPEVHGCDNPAMFYGDGRLHIIFGDPNVYTGDPADPSDGLHGAIAFTDRVVPERGLDLSHGRNWVIDPATGIASSLIERRPGTSRVNNTGGAVLPHGDGQRVWFAMYDYGSGPRPAYQNYYRVAIVYSDDFFATPAVRDEELILWDKDDPGNGPFNPDPYLGYHMRVFKDHLYMLIPREGGSSPVLIRCHLDDLDNTTLDDWHYLVSVDGNGRATWSSQGVERGQISHEDFPQVDFGSEPAGLINTVIWSPYHNRYFAFTALNMQIWEARYLWGPYTKLQTPQFFSAKQFAQSYAFFGHELMLGNNGEWLYHARARSWQPLGYYGTYNQRLHMRDRLRMTVSPKSGIAGDTIEITCRNDSGHPAPPPERVRVSVDGHPATLVGHAGDEYRFQYELTGTENGGAVGIVDVSGVMEVPMDDESAFECSRDVALVVNQRNELHAEIVAPPSAAGVSGWVHVDVDAFYDLAPETLEPRQPDVRILKVELRHVGAEETVLDVALAPPYRLRFDSTRLPDGPQRLRVVAYDTIDRRGETSLTLNIRNARQPVVVDNLVEDGNMESLDTTVWQPLYGATLTKVGGDDHRSGARSLRVYSDAPGSWAGFRQTVTGLAGGERLRLSAWSRLEGNYTAQLRWAVKDASGVTIASQYIASYGYFRRLMQEFENPADNDEITIECLVRDTGSEGLVAGEGVASAIALVDDVVLRGACFAVVSSPEDVRAEPVGADVLVAWDPVRDVGIEYYGVERKPEASGPEAWERLADVPADETSYLDETLPGPIEDYAYRVVSIDAMGWESDEGVPDLATSLIRLDSDGCPDVAALTVRVHNVGSAPAPPPINVAYYDGEPGAGGTLLGIAQTSSSVVPGGYEDVRLDLTPALAGPHTICAVADDDGEGLGTLAECDESNNQSCDGLTFCQGAPLAVAGGPYEEDCSAGAAEVLLDGSDSQDPESQPLTYRWLTDCPGASFDDPASPTPVLSLACGPPCPLNCDATLVVTDPDGGQDTDSADILIHTPELGELSDVTAGAPPLQILDTTSHSLVVEKDSDATAYNVYADALGSWFSPTAEEGTVCGLTRWTDNLDGTVTLEYAVPEGVWIVVTAANDCGEGSAGARSDGVPREDAAGWLSCGSGSGAERCN